MKELLLKIIKQVKEPFAVLLSGGIDSSVIAQACKLLKKQFTCCVAGLKGSYDIKQAELAAQLMNLKLIKAELTEKQVISNYRRVLSLGIKGFVNQSIATVLYSALKGVKEQRALTGQGADELFCGYKAFQDLLPDYKSINELRVKKVSELNHEFKQRDLLVAADLDKELINPFMNQSLVNEALKIPVSELLTDCQRKIPLRQLGHSIGLPKELINSPKKAMQYGSSFNKVLINFRKNLNT